MKEIQIKDYFNNLLQNVNAEIQTIEMNEKDILGICKKTVDYLQDILSDLKRFVIKYEFDDTLEEIYFFKELKPLFVSKLVYYNCIYLIETKYPNGSDDVQRQYITSELNRLTAFFDRNLVFYQYYRTKATYLDDKYFLRGKPDIHIIVDSFYFETDPQFTTSYDFKIAKVLANELLQIYLMNRLHELNRVEERKKIQGSLPAFHLRWTGTKRALVELIYALSTYGDFNKGTADIKEIAFYFESVFDIDLGDYYHIYMEMKGRKVNQTRYLDLLQKNLLRRMGEDEE